MNDAIHKAIADLNKQYHYSTHSLLIPNHARPTPEEMPELIRALAQAGFTLIRIYDWRRDCWSAMVRRNNYDHP